MQPLARRSALALQRDDAETDVGDADALRKDPGVAAGRDAVAEVEVDGVGVEVDAGDDVLRATLHVSGRDPRVEPGPATDHALDAVGADDDAGTDDAVAARSPRRRAPAVALPRDAGDLGADDDLRARPPRLGGERRLEPRPIEHVADVALGDAYLGAVRRPEDDAGDAARDPRGADRVEELGHALRADALAAAYGRADGAVALEHENVQPAVGGCRLTRRDEARRSAADDQNVAVTGARHAAATRSSSTCEGRSVMDNAPTGQGAMHLRHPVQAAASTRSPSRRMAMASGGQSGMHRPHASHS